jgi:hypothetical protein
MNHSLIVFHIQFNGILRFRIFIPFLHLSRRTDGDSRRFDDLDRKMSMNQPKALGSKLFCERITLGHVSTEVPCMVRYIHRRRDTLVVTCTGRGFNTYAVSSLCPKVPIVP